MWVSALLFRPTGGRDSNHVNAICRRGAAERCRWQMKRGERVAAVDKIEVSESLKILSGTATGVLLPPVQTLVATMINEALPMYAALWAATPTVISVKA